MLLEIVLRKMAYPDNFLNNHWDRTSIPITIFLLIIVIFVES